MSQRDVERFERIVLPHLDDAYTLARYLVRDEHDAQDVVQDAVLRALRYFEGYREGDARAWLLAIVRNCCMTWLKRDHGAKNVISFDASVPSVADPRETDARAIQRSERAALARALDALPDEFREVIVLREIQELSYKEISDVVGVPIGTVMSRLARGRKRLASALGLDAKEAS
jgi:RNA polymerase sigma-70 factor, ECF subfamily